MKNNIYKYALMLGVGMAMASCADDELGNVAVPVDQPASYQKSFDVSFDGDKSLQKACVDFLRKGDWYENDYVWNQKCSEMWMYFTTGDSISVFANGKNNIFNNDFVAFGNYDTKGRFVGDAENADTYYALFPSQPDATISGGTIKAEIPSYRGNTCIMPAYYQSYYRYNAAGAICVGYTSDNKLSLHHATGYLGIGNVNSNDYGCLIYIDKIVVEASDNIAGDVTISGIEDGKPVATGGSSKTITVDNLEYQLYPFAIAMLPVKKADLKLSFYRKDGAVFSYAFPGFSVEAGQCVMIEQFKNVETFKVTFKDGNQVEEADVEKGTPLYFVEPKWTRDGYKLNWLDEQGNIYDDRFVLDDDYHSFYKGILSNRTFTAQWEKIEVEEGCFVTYPTNDGDKKIEVNPGDYFTLPELPEGAIYWENPKYANHGTNECYDSDGNYVRGRQAKDFKLQPGDKIQISESTTLYSNYFNRTVTIDANGGKFEDGSSTKELRFPDGQWVNFNSNYDSENMAFVSIYFDWAKREPDQIHKKPVRDGYCLVGFKVYAYGEWKDGISWNGNYDGDGKDAQYIAQWVKSYKIEYLDENGKVAHTGEYIDGEFFNLDYTLPSTGKFLSGWKDQDGNVWRQGSNSIAVLPELKDLVLTPIFSDKTGSSNAGYDEENYDRF